MKMKPSLLFSTLVGGLLIALPSSATNPEGQAYLDKNAKKRGVVVLPSGLQYEVVTHGSGERPESTSDKCTCHYTGTLIDGSVFDSSVERGKPTTFSPGGVIGGWTEALMLMRPGDKWRLSIPSDLAYGDKGSGAKIPAGAALIFDLELISVKPASWKDYITLQNGMIGVFLLYKGYTALFGGGGSSPQDKLFDKKFLEENKSKTGVVTLLSGLQYKVIRAGQGDAHPFPTSPCDCHYEGRCAKDYPSGKKFDSSYDRGSPTTFAPNQVIKGWTEVMQLMVEGDKWEIVVPSHLAYGDKGRVSGCLVFLMEIIKIKGTSKAKVVKKDD